jgi:RNase P subunit RPR2
MKHTTPMGKHYDFEDGCDECGKSIPPGELEVRYPQGAQVRMLMLCQDCTTVYDVEHDSDPDVDYEKWYIYEVMGMSEEEAKYG